MTLHIQMLQDIATHARAMADSIRCGNGTEYARLSAVAPGSTFPLVATAQNGWHAIVIGSRVGWVSGEYARVV